MTDISYYYGFTIEIDECMQKVKIDGNAITNPGKYSETSSRLTLDELRKAGKAEIEKLPSFKRRKATVAKHKHRLKQGVYKWNAWRKRDIVTRPLLYEANLTRESLGFTLDYVDFSNAVLIGARFCGQSLRNANFHEANLGEAKLHSADLTNANFCRTDMYMTDLQYANLTDANLKGTQLAKTNLNRARLLNCHIYGIAAWDITLDLAKQENLTVVYRYGKNNDEMSIKVDDINVAQFIYLILNNKNIGSAITAITSKHVLILGRFYDKTKHVLEAIRDKVREESLVPIIFDWPPSPNRDLTETIQLLGNMARFIIADLSDAKSIPQELSVIVPFLPSVCVCPIIRSSEPYAMYEHWQNYPSVLPVYQYHSSDELIARFDEIVMQRVTLWERAINKAEGQIAALLKDNAILREEIRRLRNG